MATIQKVLSLAMFVCCSTALAGGETNMTFPYGIVPVISLQGGYAALNANDSSQQFTGTDAQQFIYHPSDASENTGFGGVFLGIEHPINGLPWPGIFFDLGIEYNYFGSNDMSGTNAVGVEPQTSTPYHYQYKLQTQQVVGTFKLLTTVYERFHPYGEVGLGAAFNKANDFSISTTQTGSINLSPTFDSQTQTEFSYNLGIGVDVQLNNHFRAGLGYRYSHFGEASLADGTILFQNYAAPVSFGIGTSNAYANLLLAHISFVA